MSPDEYIKESEKTNNLDYTRVSARMLTPESVDLIHATLGVVTESAELADMLKKHLFYGKPVDTINIQEECGDILWYIAIICRRYNVPFEQMMADNIVKLRKRFPDRFTETAALRRNTEKELSHFNPKGNQ